MAGAFCPSAPIITASRSLLSSTQLCPQLPVMPSSRLYETNMNEPEKPKELTPDTVAEFAECSFVTACLQLAQGCVLKSVSL